MIAQTTQFLIPDWPAPASVKAAVSTKHSGNLANRVGSNADEVSHNRQQLYQELGLPQAPCWLNQVHGSTAVDLSTYCEDKVDADASYTNRPLQVCAVLTADCLPILITNRLGTEVAAIHAGWRGLLAGVIDSTIQGLKSSPEQLLVWLGPCIGPDHFEVNADIRQEYSLRYSDFTDGFFQVDQRWFANLYDLAKINLRHCGVTAVFGGGLCTYCDPERFYSYRRDRGVIGHEAGCMASLIWISNSH